MGICVYHVKSMVRNRSSSLVLSLHEVEGKMYPVMDSPIHGEYDGASCKLCTACVRKLQSCL